MSKQLFLNSADLQEDGAALRARAAVEGYLFFRGLLPREDVAQVRRDLLNVVREFGWLAPGQDDLGGRLNLEQLNQVPESEMRMDIGVSTAAYEAAQRLESVHRLPHHPHLLKLFTELLDGEVLVHPRHIIRMITGHKGMVPTPPHQDFPLIQGTPQTWTCWFPVSDCPRDYGALTVLRGSNQKGYLPVRPAPGAGGIAAQLCPGENEWVEGDFEAGDELMFPSYTVHRALPTAHKDEIRLSFDVRYQRVDENIESRSLAPHCNLDWPQIYQDWQSGELQYYWKKHTLQFSPYVDSMKYSGRRIC
jgi:hypothetical protein